jgi:hypothetical protein
VATTEFGGMCIDAVPLIISDGSVVTLAPRSN